MDIRQILTELRRERKKIDRAIVALESLDTTLGGHGKITSASKGAASLGVLNKKLRKGRKARPAKIITFPKTAERPR